MKTNHNKKPNSESRLENPIQGDAKCALSFFTVLKSRFLFLDKLLIHEIN